MTRRCTLVLVVLCGWGLAEGSARAQGLGGLRNRGYGYGYWGPWDSQAAQAERDAQQREAQERAAAALRSSVSQYEAGLQATAERSDAALQAAAARTAASQQAAVQGAWATYQASVERRVAALQRQAASLPTDIGPAAPAAPAASSADLRSTQESSPSVRSARGAAARAGFQRYELFTPSWFEKNPSAWRPAKWAGAGTDAWGGVDWPTLQRWLGWTGQHGSFEYGESLVIKGNQVLFRGTPIAKADEYYVNSLNIAQAGAAAEPKDGEWQPLGVFALHRDDNTESAPVVQLAVNKEGLVRGNTFDPLTGAVTGIRGKADRTLFLAACVVGDKQGPVVEAGIYNLTLDEVPLLYHLDKDKTQQMLLVRLTRPAAGAGGSVEQPPAFVPASSSVGVVALRLPADAEVWFDGTRINLEGTERKLTTPPLEPGQSYYYHVRARWTENGRPVEQTRKVNVQAGDRTVVDFLSPAP